MSDPRPLPPPESLVVRAGAVAEGTYRNPQNPASEVHARALALTAGLRRVGLDHVRIPPGKESIAFHLHHAEEEFMFVLEGRGVAEIGDGTFAIGPGDFLGFPPGTHPHHVRNAGDTDLRYLAGGEGRSIEIVDYPREGVRAVRIGETRTRYPLSAGEVVSRDEPVALPAPRALLFTVSERGATPEERAGHPLDPRCEVHRWTLGERTGLRRVGVNLERVPPGRQSSAPHLHHAEEEFAYVLAGRGTVELGDARVPVGPGDFVGFLPGTFAHVLVNEGTEDLVFLAGGERRAIEVADLPRAGARIVKLPGGAERYPLRGVPFSG